MRKCVKFLLVIFLCLFSKLEVNCHYDTVNFLDNSNLISKSEKKSYIEEYNMEANASSDSSVSNSGALIRCFWMETTSFAVFDLFPLQSSMKTKE